MPKAAFLLSDYPKTIIYPADLEAALRKQADFSPGFIPGHEWPRHREALAEVEFVFSGWGMPVMDEAFLAALPRLKAVFYGAGSVRGFYPAAARERGVILCSAWRMNAIPVAEFTFAGIIMSLKDVWQTQQAMSSPSQWKLPPHAVGAYRTRVGLVSLGAIGQTVVKWLRRTDLEICVHDPFLDDERAASLGVTPLSLEELFATSHVVSLHTPLLPETQGMITAGLLGSMREGATLINTARGGLIDHTALIETLRARPDLTALLDVTEPEPPAPGSDLWTLPNVFITPHLAGSIGSECARMGWAMAEEFARYQSGQPLQHEVTEAIFKTMA